MSLISNRREQDFMLYEVLEIESLLKSEVFADSSRDAFDMTLDMAQKIGEKELLPRLMEADREGTSLVNGEVKVPKCYHDLQKIVAEGGWFTISAPVDCGGQGMPYVIEAAAQENFLFHMAYFMYSGGAVGASHLIYDYGTEEQKQKYMYKMLEGKYGGTMALTEPDAGSDVGALKTKAYRQPDGSFRIKGQKIFISGGDSDLYENIVHPILARIEGDPEGTSGISIFLVPKFIVNEDGSLGQRNDYSVSGIEHKMGLMGNATCSMSFGDNDNCYAELLGEERQGMKIMFKMMIEERINMGIQGLSTGSAAYHHALEYAKERIQGKSLMDMMNPDAKPVAIINHPDVRRMLLWMKSHVDALRGMVYICAYAIDKSRALPGDESEKWQGIMEFMVPVLKAWGTDTGFRITETAMQVYGGYGYCKDYPVEQLLRDMKIGSIYEGTNGIQSMDLVLRKLNKNNGKDFNNLIAEMEKTLKDFPVSEPHEQIGGKFRDAINTLTETGAYFSTCMKEKKFLIPVVNTYPFLTLTGYVLAAWVLYRQAGVADKKLGQMLAAKGINARKGEEYRKFIESDREAAFYENKIITASYFMNHVMPQAIAIKDSIETGDISPVRMRDDLF